MICLGTALPATISASDQTTVTYLAPLWNRFLSSSDGEAEAAVQALRSRIGEGAGARLGFAVYIQAEMTDWNVDTSSSVAIRAALARFEAEVDTAVARARRLNIVLVINVLTAIRSNVDAAQQASYEQDRRVMQWYSDNHVAGGWWTHSRYARKQYRVQRAYFQEMAKILASRVAQYGDTLVAISGDGEIELSYDRTFDSGGPILADYSPFAIAEFRDWLRGTGLYATGQPFDGQAYAFAARYRDDPSPGQDASGGDGHTLDGDFGQAFTSWNLRYFDWSLADNENADVNAIPQATYTAGGFNPLPNAGLAYFDAPRVRQTSSAWWQLWDLFRQTMVWRHNQDIAKWMTTTIDDQGRTLSNDRWFSYQIPADYLFGHTPSDPDVRLATSASPWWTANVRPYGGLGFTAFGANQGGGNYARTLPALLNAIQPCRSGQTPPACLSESGGLATVPWGIFEWNPSVPSTTDPAIYRDEIEWLRRYRPRVLVPYAWANDDYRVLDSGFEDALRRLVTYLQNGWTPSLHVSRTALSITATRSTTAITSSTPSQSLLVSQPSGGLVDWSASADRSWLSLSNASGHGSGTFDVALNTAIASSLAPGTYQAAILVSAPGSIEGQRRVTVTLTVLDSTTSQPPFGSFDTPANGATGLTGAIAVTGWALDNVGIDHIEIWRNCVETIDRPAGACASAVPGGPANFVFIGRPAFLSGARPDVEAANPSHPLSYRAGWGYLMLTSALPHLARISREGGQGTFTLTAYAVDRENLRTLLGQKTISLDNDHATVPFGAIDTPDQGATIPAASAPFNNAAAYPNFGWAMTQPGKCIDTSTTSSYRVYIDGVSRTLTPGVNWFAGLARTDLMAAYPGLCNSSSALAAYYINADALGLADGLHTIGWDVIDNQGNVAGIGSRFFNLFRTAPGASSLSPSDP